MRRGGTSADNGPYVRLGSISRRNTAGSALGTPKPEPSSMTLSRSRGQQSCKPAAPTGDYLSQGTSSRSPWPRPSTRLTGLCQRCEWNSAAWSQWGQVTLAPSYPFFFAPSAPRSPWPRSCGPRRGSGTRSRRRDGRRRWWRALGGPGGAPSLRVRAIDPGFVDLVQIPHPDSVVSSSGGDHPAIGGDENLRHH